MFLFLLKNKEAKVSTDTVAVTGIFIPRSQDKHGLDKQFWQQI
jgi:hypothetical protein